MTEVTYTEQFFLHEAEEVSVFSTVAVSCAG
jgi:hypothetical protein